MECMSTPLKQYVVYTQPWIQTTLHLHVHISEKHKSKINKLCLYSICFCDKKKRSHVYLLKAIFSTRGRQLTFLILSILHQVEQDHQRKDPLPRRFRQVNPPRRLAFYDDLSDWTGDFVDYWLPQIPFFRLSESTKLQDI